MKLGDSIVNYENCQIYESMLQGLEVMLFKAPESDKKDMLKDIVKLGKIITKNYKSHLNSNDYLQVENTRLEILYKQKEHEAKHSAIMLERFKKGL